MVIAGLSVTLLLIVFGRLETAPSRRATVTGLLTSIVRKQGRPDVLLPTACPSACQPLFRADEAAVPDGPLSGRCSCVCPRTAPVYLHTAGHCVDRLDECRYNLAFNSSVDTERLIPVVSLPAKNGVVFPKVPILWNSSGIIVSASNTVDCTVSEVFVDNVEHRWKAVSRRVLFDISTARGRPMVMFRGSDAEVTMLTGAVVQLKLSCNGFAADEHCLSFRVTGVSGAIPHVTPSSSSRVELLLICLLLFLLVLSIGGSLVLWQMCWRIKKQKLISTIQMQFLFHLQQQQEVRKVVETQAAMNDIGPCEFKTLMERIPKRRLYFSAEYLDKEMMENPPPMAEQFLIDLRRVIEIARERIRMRRFVPMLITIPEDLEEGRSTVTGEDNAEKAVSDMYHESPKSDKSVDSGRESRSDSDDSSRDEEEEEKTRNWPDVHSQPDRIHKVRSIVNGFESQSAMRTATPQQQPNRPLPKTPTAVTKTQSSASRIPTLLGRSSPRPLQKSLALLHPPPLPKTPPPRTPTQCRTRRGYAVFPADPMLNKSLPRRKRTTPRLVEGAAASS